MKIKHLVLLTAILFTTINCEEDESVDPGTDGTENPSEEIPDDFTDNFGQEITASFIGRVVDEAGASLVSATVTVGNEVATTDTNGLFSFSSASVYEKFAHLLVEKQGYISTARAVAPDTAGTTVLEIEMLGLTDSEMVASGSASTVAVDSGASVTLDGAFVDESNAPYSGTAEVFVRHLSPDDEDFFSQMPGMLIGKNGDGAARVLESAGMIAVELRGENGEELQLAGTSVSQITIPLSEDFVGTPPSTIPLWYFDEDLGYWVEEGEATLQGNTYVGEVAHFSFWNYNFAHPSVFLCVTLEDAEGNPLPYNPINMYSPALHAIGTYGFANNEGVGCGLVPRGDQMYLTIPDYGCDGTNFSTLIGPFTEDSEITVTVSDPDVNSAEITARFTDCDGNAVTEGYVEMWLPQIEESLIYPLNGEGFSLHLTYCSFSNGFSLQAVDSDGNRRSEVIQGDLVDGTTELGTITICEDIPNALTAQNDFKEGILVSSSLGAEAVLNVLENDRINDVEIDPESVSLIFIPSDNNPSDNIFLDQEGNVHVLENVPSGQYTFQYTMCERADPENCTSATIVLFITNSSERSVFALDDFDDAINGSPDSFYIFDIIANDTINGAPATPEQVDFKVLESNFGDYFSVYVNEPDRRIDVIKNDFEVPPGTYTAIYEICEIENPESCDTATIELIVIDHSQNTIVLNDDVVQLTNPLGDGQIVYDPLANDTFNGAAIDTDEPLVSIEILESDFENNFIFWPMDADFGDRGKISSTIDMVPAGTYTATYQICELANPDNCDTAMVTLEVLDGDTNTIVATDDTWEEQWEIQSDPVTLNFNVLDNDTFNGDTVPIEQVSIAVLSDEFGVNDFGNLIVYPETPPGTYTVSYQLCENLAPNNCSNAEITLTLNEVESNPSFEVANDAAENIDGATGNPNVLNILDNDTLNGEAIDSNQIEITYIEVIEDYFITTSNGTIGVKANTPTGTYSFEYELTYTYGPNQSVLYSGYATVTLNVVNENTPYFNVANDAADIIVGDSGNPNVLNILENDRLNGETIDFEQIGILYKDIPNYITTGTNGTLGIQQDTPSGTYTFEYQLSYTYGPNQSILYSDYATVTLYVVNNTSQNEIVANDDFLDGIDGDVNSLFSINILENDILNGEQIFTNDVEFSILQSNFGDYFSTDVNEPDMRIDVLKNDFTVPAGTYTATYQICEANNPDNCDTATIELIVVSNRAQINLVDDTLDGIDGINGATNVLNVLNNDTIIGLDNPFPSIPSGARSQFITLNEDGSVDVAPGTPQGEYQFSYWVSDPNHEDNNVSATLTLFVNNNTLNAINAAYDSVYFVASESNTLINIYNILDNDTLGFYSDFSNLVEITPSNLQREYITLNVDGSIDISPNTPTGNYSFVYSICEANTDNCSTADVYLYVLND